MGEVSTSMNTDSTTTDEPKRERDSRPSAIGLAGGQSRSSPATASQALGKLVEHRELVGRIDQLRDPTAIEQAMRLRAIRGAARSALAINQHEHAAELLHDSLSQFEQPHWTHWRDTTAKHYKLLVLLSVRMGRNAEALDLFEKARLFITLDPDIRRSLARAAAELRRIDFGAARLFIDRLKDDLPEPEREELLSLLRNSIRIDWLGPATDRLAEAETLNAEAREVADRAWMAAHLSIAAFRKRQPSDALRLRDEAWDTLGLDGEAGVLLGTVSYLCREWSTAEELFQLSEELAPYLVPLARANRLLNDPASVGDRTTLIRHLQEVANALARPAPKSGPALDAHRTRGMVLAGLDQFQPAVQAFATAGGEPLTWRTVRAEMESLGLVGRDANVRLEELKQLAPRNEHLFKLLESRAALDRMDLAAVRSGFEEATNRVVEEPWFDGDLTAVAECLRTEWTHASAGHAVAAPSIHEPANVSASVRAWMGRLNARWHLERGELAEALTRLAEPDQWAAMNSEFRFLEGIAEGLLGDETTAGKVFEELATSPPAPVTHRLAFGLWLTSRERFDEARPILETVSEQRPEAIEPILALVRGDLAAKSTDRAKARFNAFLGENEHPARLMWLNSPRFATYRPWQRKIPSALWTLPAKESMHRIGDLLEGADLLLGTSQLIGAAGLVALAEESLGNVLPDLAPQVGDLRRRLALAELAAGNVEAACRLHALAVDLQAGEPEFANLVARALASVDVAPELALQVFCDAATTFPGIPELEAAEVGQALQRLLAVGEPVAIGPAEAERRVRWTRNLLEARPKWDWPKRNLAHAAALAGQSQTVLDHLATIASPIGKDHLLAGHAAWNLRRFSQAASAFNSAVDGSAGLPDSRAWRGVARTAAFFGNEQVVFPSDAEADGFLADLDPAACTPAFASVVRSWRGAVSVAARRQRAALEVLDPSSSGEENREQVSVLRGAALVLAGKNAEALDHWNMPDVSQEFWSPALRALLLAQRPGPADSGSVANIVRSLRQRGTDERLLGLLEAEATLSEGHLCKAVVLPDANAFPPLLLPLRPLLEAERLFIEARRQQHQGHLEDAITGLERVEALRFWPAIAGFWRAVCLAEAGRIEAAESLFVRLAKSVEVAADAEAQLAMLRLHTGDREGCGRHAHAAIAIEPQQPFAKLALAMIAAERGKYAEAMKLYRDLIDSAKPGQAVRAIASASLALGRLEEKTGKRPEAEVSYRKALELRPGWSAGCERLGLLLSLGAQANLEESESLLSRVANPGVTVDLARAAVAHRLARVDDMAVHLNRLINRPEFQKLPKAVGRQVALWGAEVRLLRKEFGAAADALEQLARVEPTPAIEERLVQCRLLQAVQVVQQIPLADGALDEALSAAEGVLNRRPKEPLALVLATACRLLLGKKDEPRTLELVQAVRAVRWPTDRQSLLAAAVRLLSGDNAAAADIEKHAKGDREAMKHLSLVSANLTRKTDAFEAQAKLFVDAEKSDGPFDPEDVIFVAALAAVAKQKYSDATRLFDEWHKRGRGTKRSKLAHAQLLGREAAKSIKTDIPKTRDLLLKAVELLS